MTTEEKDYAKSLRWIIFSGDYALTEAMNCVIEKDWIRECDSAHIFEAPENQLTDIGKIVIKRLMFVRDFLGIELTYDILIQVFAKVKAENGIRDKNEAILTEFRIREALEREDFEEVLRLKREFSVSNSRRD